MEEVKHKSRLFLKVFVGFFIAFLITITVISLFTQRSLEEHLLNEYRSKGKSVAESISDSSVNLILNSDPATIQSILNQYLEITGVVYILVRDTHLNILAHTFVPGVPKELDQIERKHLKQGRLDEGEVYHLNLHEYGQVIEVISPLVLGKIGYVHVGMSLAPIHNTIKTTVIKTLLLIFALFLLSVVLLYLFILQISKPIKLLTAYAQTLSNHDFKSASPMQNEIKNLTVKSKDEIGNLAYSFVKLEDQLIQYIKDLETTTLAKKKIEGEIKVAADIQLNMLPKKSSLPATIPVDIEGTLIPAKEVGGDFYDYFVKDNYLCFAVGDVSGKGVPAALFMSATLTMLESASLKLDNVSDILTNINNLLESRNDHCLFVTLLFGILDMNTGLLTYCNAGHPPALIMKQSGEFLKLPTTNGMAVGIEQGFYYQNKTIQLDQSDTLLLFTDGITEAENTRQNLYGDERIDAIFKRVSQSKSCEMINQFIIDDVKNFTKGASQSDDITLLSLRWKGNNVTLKDKVKVHFENDLQELLKLQRVVEMFSEENKLSTKVTMNTNLILEELLTNTISYGYEDHDTHLIYVMFSIEQNELLIEIEDDAMPFNPLEREDVDTSKSLDDTAVGGLGIHFVKSLVSDIAYERRNDKNVLTLKMELKGTQHEDFS